MAVRPPASTAAAARAALRSGATEDGAGFGGDGPGLVEVLRRFAATLAPLVAGLDPATVHANDAAAIVAEVVAVERRLAGLRLACAARAAESSAVATGGNRSAEHWYAQQAGVGLQQARRSLRTSQRLQALDRTREQAMAGGLSEAQLGKVADAASANPNSEPTLLQAAGRHGLRGLAAVCDRAKAEARDEEQEQQRLAAVHRRRFLRHSRTADGAFRLEMHTTPDAGARVLAAIDRRADDLFHAARRAGRREPHHAYQADALVDLVTAARAARAPARATAHPPADPVDDLAALRSSSTGAPTTSPTAHSSPTQPDDPLAAGAAPRPGPSATITFVVDIEALRRGRLAPGERCELTGTGPVPLAMVERYLADSRIDLVVTSHTDIAAVCTLSRTIPRALRLALELRDPTCAVPGCDVTAPLEIDHIIPYAQGGATHIDNLCRLCPHHHDLKTYRGWTITGPPGDRRFRPPDEPDTPTSATPTSPTPTSPTPTSATPTCATPTCATPTSPTATPAAATATGTAPGQARPGVPPTAPRLFDSS